MASLPQGLSAIRYCIELHGIIANDNEVQGLALSTSSGVTLAPMLNVEGINSFDVKIPHYTVHRNTQATFEPTAKASPLQVPFRQQLLIGFLFDTILVCYRIPLSLQGRCLPAPSRCFCVRAWMSLWFDNAGPLHLGTGFSLCTFLVFRGSVSQ